MQSLLLSGLAIAGVTAQATAQAAQGPVTGQLGNATVVTNNQPNLYFKATFPEKAFDAAAYPNGGNVKGGVIGASSPDGIGVNFNVSFSNLPKEGGPFGFHIHDQRVPEDGNCTATLGHLDPFVRGDDPKCDPTLPQTCQVGDLAGKYGKASSDPYSASFHDMFVSTSEGVGAFFGNRSIVFHYANKTRITCANFERVDGPDHALSGAPHSTSPTSQSCSAPANAPGTPSNATPAVVPPPQAISPGNGSTPAYPPPPPVTVSAGSVLGAGAGVAFWSAAMLALAMLALA